MAAFGQELTMSFPKEVLIKQIQENRDTHRSVFEAALEGYRTEAVKRLERQIEEIKAGKLVSHFSLTLPEDHTDDYDTVLSMLNACVDEEIELTMSDYAMYMLDEWSWKKQFITSNSLYAAGAVRDAYGE